MHSKDYKKIAEILHEGKKRFESYPPDALICIDAFEYIATELVNYFKLENERFDERLFLDTINRR